MPFALITSIIGGSASGKAANEQADAAKHAADIQKQMFDQTQQNLSPFISAGPNALANLLAGLGTSQNPGSLTKPFDWSTIAQNPAYQFIQQQGEQSILDTASATGGIGGGNTLKALTQFGQGNAATFGNQLFDQYLAQQQNTFSDLFNLAGLSENAAAGQGTIGANVGANIGQDLIGAGNAQAAGTVGTANAITGGLNGMANNFLLAQALSGGGGGGIAALLGA